MEPTDDSPAGRGTLAPPGNAALGELGALNAALGLPAARAVFKQMLTASGLQGVARQTALRAIDDLSPVMDESGMEVNFYDVKTRVRETAYLYVDQCPRVHDLTAQLGPLKARLAPEQWPQIVQQCSFLVSFVRLVYGQLAEANRPLIRALFGLPGDDPCAAYMRLAVDPANTTLFLVEDWPHRVGLHVHFGRPKK